MSTINKVQPRLKSSTKRTVSKDGSGKVSHGKTEVVKQRLVDSGLEVPSFNEEGLRSKAISRINEDEMNRLTTEDDLTNFDTGPFTHKVSKSYVILGNKDTQHQNTG